jgi:hypothetical protein
VSPDTPTSSVSSIRSQLVLLHVLVTIVLCYELLFSGAALLPRTWLEAVILGLFLCVFGLLVLPARMVEGPWFPGALTLGDTAITTAIIYLSGNGTSDMYLAYFVIILIAASSRTLKKVIALTVFLCAAYGGVLFVEDRPAGVLLEGYFIRVPLLMVMGVFYGVTVERIGKLSREKSDLLDYIAERARAEQERERLLNQLQEAMANIKTLRGLLPICSHCKKIRDDTGYWHNVEAYIREHTEAEFSHGICPTCLNKHYPDFEPGK